MVGETVAHRLLDAQHARDRVPPLRRDAFERRAQFGIVDDLQPGALTSGNAQDARDGLEGKLTANTRRRLTRQGVFA